MYNEHCQMRDSNSFFTAWNAGHVIRSTAIREWFFVVGSLGVDRNTWEIDMSMAEPEIADDMMVTGRNAKRLADLMERRDVKRAGLVAAEVVAIRLYTGGEFP